MSRFKLTFAPTEMSKAQSLATLLEQCGVPAPDAVSVYETEPNRWAVEANYADAPDAAAVAAQMNDALAQPIAEPIAQEIEDENWVALSQAGLPPVEAGRFYVHGSHDRALGKWRFNAIEIDAGEAFGTAHHATTYGCLLATDRVTRNETFESVLDLGCGSAVLAIAAAKALPRAHIMASDIDVQATDVARRNCKVNGVANRIDIVAAMGFDHPRLRTPASFDLVIANILAAPLINMARDIARATAPGGTTILSGILEHQANEVRSAFRAAGYVTVRHDVEEGWSTIQLRRHENRTAAANI